VPSLPEYGTAYVLYDDQDAGYSYAIKSDRYRFSEYVGLQTEASSPLPDVGKELAVMNVTHIQLDEMGKGDTMLSGPGERENTLVAPTYTDLAGKVAVVTGGSGGIGAATCRMLAANGMKVVVNGRDEAKIGAVVDAIRSADGEAIGVAADCTDFAAVERMRKQAEEELGPIGVVAAFAGGGRARPGPVEQTTEEEWRSTVDANLTATFLTLKSFLPGMIERGGGSFVTMASSAARFPTGAPAPYAAAKAGVIMLTRQVANEAGNHGVRVNCLAPHTVLVERTRRFMSEEQQRRIAAEIPLRRLGTPEDVALATLFLASESSSWITGVTLDVAGGKVTG
jgi:3-oxoacyl-[acyl-carrier protein] reductase